MTTNYEINCLSYSNYLSCNKFNAGRLGFNENRM